MEAVKSKQKQSMEHGNPDITSRGMRPSIAYYRGSKQKNQDMSNIDDRVTQMKLAHT